MRAHPLQVALVNMADEFGLLLVNLQGGQLANGTLAVAVGLVSHIASGLDGLHQAPPHTLADHLQLKPGEKGLHLRQLLVSIVGEVVGLAGTNDLRFGQAEGFQDDALLGHGATAQTVNIHAEHAGIGTGLHLLQQAQHLRSGVERFAGNDFLKDVRLGNVHPHFVSQLHEHGSVFDQHLGDALVGLVSLGFAQVQRILVFHTKSPP